jgi:hypothetical protein
VGWAGSEAKTHGPGGVALLARVTELAEETIRRVLAELEDGERLERGQVRRAGGGGRPVVEVDPSVVRDLDRLVDPATRVDPESPLRWTSKSLAKLREALVGMGHEISGARSGSCSRGRGFGFRPTRRRVRDPSIPTATGGLRTSTDGQDGAGHGPADQHRLQKEGTGRRLQGGGARVGALWRASPGARARLP